MISGSPGEDTRFAVLFVDLDHFKLINDTLGHECGDALLKQIAARLIWASSPRRSSFRWPRRLGWQREGFPSLCISVNLTTRQFNDEYLRSSVLSTLENSGMAANMLELEISEATLMQDSERSARTLASLKHAGVRLAIDNFGAGYVSLANIQKFPINTLKVDRSLLRDLEQNSDSRIITEAIIALGKSLSLTVIAEGVETRRQAAFLREQACDAMQGFYVNEPTAAPDFGRLLRHQAELAAQKPAPGQQ